uniref:Uncharacterized protein n=1 Tax=mine drainage metagenome TaxID=410659 RepID=E6QRV2_9ZZZZ
MILSSVFDAAMGEYALFHSKNERFIYPSGERIPVLGDFEQPVFHPVLVKENEYWRIA